MRKKLTKILFCSTSVICAASLFHKAVHASELTVSEPVAAALIEEDVEAWEAEVDINMTSLESEIESLAILSYTMTVSLTDPNAVLELSSDSYELYPESNNVDYTKLNAKHLQDVVDAVSDAGGGTITIPTGTYYFFPLQKNFDNENSILTTDNINYLEYHVIKCRDNVTINGTLTSAGALGTTLSPVASLAYPVDMFYHADLIDRVTNKYDTAQAKWLENADFNNFIIDYSYTENYGHYNAKGKAFFFVLLKNCDWNNVTVKNTDGTGFGVDCPINCTIKNCTAIGCGKQATSSDVGASGFGIGFGYSNDESMLIENCTAIGNRKFGFFFEDQARFEAYYQATTSNGFVVKNCTSRGNRYNFGGEMCSNTHFIDCTSEPLQASDPNPLKIANKAAYYFGNNSTDYHITKGGTEINQYVANKDYYTDVYGWFVDDGWFEKILASGIMYGYADANGELTFVFGQEDLVTRGQMAVMLYRYCFPNKALNMSVTNATPFVDNLPYTFYTEAMNWAFAEGIFAGYKNPDGSLTGYILPEGNITREELATVLFRFAQKHGADTTNYNKTSHHAAPDAGTVSFWASDAIAWCYTNKVMSGNGSDGSISPAGRATRSQAAKMILQSLETIP